MDTDVIYIADSHPDKPRVLFHEVLHFMFKRSLNCHEVVKSEHVQHVVIDYLTNIYLKETKRPTSVGNEWLYDDLEKIGIKVEKQVGGTRHGNQE